MHLTAGKYRTIRLMGMSAENAYAMVASTSSISRLMLGADRRQSVLASHALMALAVYVVFAGVQHVEVLLGLIDRSDSWALTTWNDRAHL